MKKAIFALMCTLFCFMAITAQNLTNNEVSSIISMSKEANTKNGIVNPDVIQPGQTLTFLFQDGSEAAILVEAGDSQWKILKGSLSRLQKIHGPVVSYPDGQAEDKVVENTPPVVSGSTKSDWNIPIWVWCVFAAIVVTALIVSNIREAAAKKKKIHSDPVTSGTPMKPGGVRSSEAFTYAGQVANRTFNNQTFTVTGIEKGMISGKNLTVYYAGEPNGQRKTFTNVPGYRGRVNLNGTEQFVYFLQGCGNDVRSGQFHTGDEIQFVPDVTQASEIVEANTSAQRQQVIAQTKGETPDNGIANIAPVVTALVAPMNGKDCGKFTIKNEGDGKFTIEMSFGMKDVTSNNEVKEELKSEVKHS